jgi:hypothetical protein
VQEGSTFARRARAKGRPCSRITQEGLRLHRRRNQLHKGEESTELANLAYLCRHLHTAQLRGGSSSLGAMSAGPGRADSAASGALPRGADYLRLDLEKVAETDVAALSSMEHAPVPLHAPLHPTNRAPFAGVAFRVTAVPLA